MSQVQNQREAQRSRDSRGSATSSIQTGPRSWWHGRSELGVAAFVFLLAAVFAIGTATMDVPATAGVPGPQFFPTIVVILLFIVSIALAITVIRRPARDDEDEADQMLEISPELLEDIGQIDTTSEIRVVTAAAGEERKKRDGTDWKTLGIVFAALAGTALLLEPLGWIITAAALFWVVAYALGSKRHLFDIGVAFLFSSLVQLSFSAGLGLTLPSGILSGVLPWIS
ncbi:MULTISPECIES: tripartite tricarboxylate transporter TctB family protein [unclassified Pseudoclavibacter]|uniref:tripartite tricarboxylate transporter TctB family protein n=1 Tax=unclassified Pseudoclavibacter TaxID=2615177 RepID=UPI0015CD32A6|nr:MULTISPECIES: tripartite tricarboxylate transporter TctB family protein [unclassified Pseudoclavibacter]MBS3179615.1 tripartite tricarboxylate transporter TctB family protein [Pseudoclavibacter sp. Marseille-Q4354]NYF14560.1 putative tricarboxylic transport membrane protein [Pseudoclavibacter sp. JAI123]